ncbi:MAG: type II secretion system protein [Candidatus Gracilibacteria bacterium]
MNTQKTQTSNVKGFTLVELIVVITILVILGTIAFLNLGGMSATARDSQRTSDLNQINTQIMVAQAKQGLSYMNMVSGYGRSLSNANLAGAVAASGATYAGGDVNYTVLGIDSAKFSDPVSGAAYKIGATSLAGTAYELAASLEEGLTARVMGVYKARGITGADISTGTGTATLTNIALAATDIGKFKNGDTLAAIAVAGGTTAVCPSAKIISVSADMKTLGFICTTAGVIAPGAIKLANAESTGLISQTGSTTVSVVNNGTALPY